MRPTCGRRVDCCHGMHDSRVPKRPRPTLSTMPATILYTAVQTQGTVYCDAEVVMPNGAPLTTVVRPGVNNYSTCRVTKTPDGVAHVCLNNATLNRCRTTAITSTSSTPPGRGEAATPLATQSFLRTSSRRCPLLRLRRRRQHRRDQ